MADGLPKDVAESVDLFIDTLDGLEVLVAVARDREREWTAEQMAAHLRIAERTAGDELGRLASRGVLQASTAPAVACWRWSPGEREQKHVARIVDYYDRRRIEVLNYVASSSLKRLRGLSEAFRLRRDDGR